MTDLTPEFCPHCLVNFAKELVEIKTSNPPKCGRCLLPLWWEDRSGKEPDKAWQSYTKIKELELELERLRGFKLAVYRLLVDGVGPGGGGYKREQRLDAAISLLLIGWAS